MKFEEYRKHDAVALGQLIKKKEVTPAELLELAIARCEAVNGNLNAVILKLYDMARTTATGSLPDSPLSGVPYLIKDLGPQLKGTRFTVGSRAFKDFISPEDSEVTKRMKAAGLVIFGKTNTPEYGLTPFTEPLFHGPTKNPWNNVHSPGGSSGGSAAAVAAGIVPMGSANDGGGSIRIPAACCGLFGMKLSRGRVSLGDYIGEQWGGAVSEGLVTRSVRDSAVYYDLVMGPGRGEPYVVDKPAVPFSEEIQKQPGSLRIAYTLDHPLGHKLDEDTNKAMNETVALLQSLGHKVEQIKLPYPKEVLTEMLFMLVVGETSAELSLIERYTGRKVTHRDVEPNTWMLSELGRAYSAHDFALAKKTWNEVGRKMGLLHDSYDIFLTPTLGRKPIKIGELQNPPIEEAALKIFNTLGLSSLLRRTGIVDKIADKIYSYIPYTPLQNITGQPSMSVPLYWSPSDQLPVGMMFSSAINNEAVLWRLAAQLEQAKPWFDRVPS